MHRESGSVWLPRGLRIGCAIGLMAVIFYFSSQNGAQSHGLSRGVMRFLESLQLRLGIGGSVLSWLDTGSDQLLRKLAHFSLYFLLGLLFYWVFKDFQTSRLKASTLSVACCLIYSVTDEIHQVFIRGRTFLYTDMLIDGLGALTGMLLVYCFHRVGRRRGIRSRAPAGD